MTTVEKIFLDALKASLQNRILEDSVTLTPEETVALFQMAEAHHVLPMIYETVYQLPAVKNLGPQFEIYFKRKVIKGITMQTMKTQQFHDLYRFLLEKGIKPCVVKGIICRNLYPNPDARMSSDEDLLIPWDSYETVHEFLSEYGMVVSDPSIDCEKIHEVSYIKVGSPLYIELHKSLFSSKSEAYGNLNEYFTGIHNKLIEEEIEGTRFWTMNPTDHLFYLICHSYKHFLHSGFGLRQVCDIILYANTYGRVIDWDYVLKACREIRADLFAAAMFITGEKYLTFDPEKACFSEGWKSIDVDETLMLQDLLASGVYGQSDMSRKHSSNITLNAIIADRRGETAKTGRLRSVIKSVCLPVRSLSGRFPYLKKFPFLLPVAWAQRVLIYKKETAGNVTGNNAADSIKIGNERVELMRKYGIIQ